jgi:DNA-binding NtrC family response regulator
MLMPIGTNKTRKRDQTRAPQRPSRETPTRSAVVPKSDELSDTLEAAALDLAQISSMNSRFHTGVSSGYGDEAKDQVAEAKERSGLVLLYAPNFEQLSPAYVFASPELTIGRDASNLICVPEQAVSRQHARIFARPDRGGLRERWFLADLQSRNGTMVDGQYVTEIELEPNMEIRTGDAIFKFVEAGAERYVGYRIDGRTAGQRRAMLFTELVGGARMDHIAADIERIAPKELSAVILGETGTGKEVIARGIHRLSGRRGSFQAINCAAIPPTLLESELFGYRRGAFSGADRDKPGLIKLADQGTLFLDEIGDMPLDAQAKLLRVLQLREVFPIGATAPEHVDIRVVCATHRDLYEYAREGKFRGDLLARLNEHVVRVPPLRDRKEDIFLLARSFAAKYGRPNLAFTFSFVVALIHYDWPFNVRELESCIKRGVALTDAQLLDTVHLPDAITEHMKGYGERPSVAAQMNPQAYPSNLPPPMMVHPTGPPPPMGVSIPPPGAPRRGAPTEYELRELLQRHHGNVAAVGRELGKERMQIHRWLKKYNIDLGSYR